MKFKTLAKKMKNGQDIDFAKMAKEYQPFAPIAIDENYSPKYQYAYDWWNCCRESHTIEFLDGSHCDFYIGWCGGEASEFNGKYENMLSVIFSPNNSIDTEKTEYFNELMNELAEYISWDDEECSELSKGSISEDDAEEKIQVALNEIVNKNAKMMAISHFFNEVTSIKDKDEIDEKWEELKYNEGLSKTDIEILKKAAAEFKKQLDIKKDFEQE